jgi:hypothetical protein
MQQRVRTELSARRHRPVEPAPPRRSARPDWREAVTTLSGLNLLAGIWLVVAPWVLGYSGADPRWNDWVFGAIVGILALVRITAGQRDSWLSWINALVGVWLFVAAFTIDQTSAAQANDIVLGVIVFVLAVASAAATPQPGRRGSAA